MKLSGIPFRDRILLYLAIAALAVSIAYAFQRRTRSSVEGKVIEAGLIESGNRPTLYINLRNTGETTARYMYTVRYNKTKGDITSHTGRATVPPGRTFGYTLVLTRPSDGVMVLNLKIYRGDTADEHALLHNQTWIIRANP